MWKFLGFWRIGDFENSRLATYRQRSGCKEKAIYVEIARVLGDRRC